MALEYKGMPGMTEHKTFYLEIGVFSCLVSSVCKDKISPVYYS